jgi:hypothetical protein
MSPRRLLALVLCAGSVVTTDAAAAPREVSVTGSRVHVRDLVPNTDEAVAGIDLGPAPLPGASRLIGRADIIAALAGHTAPRSLPTMVRVVRKMHKLVPAELDGLVRASLAPDALHAGVSLRAVRSEHAIDVAEGWTRVTVEVPRAPKKVGVFATTAVVTFLQDAQPVDRVFVPVDLDVSVEGATFDAPRGRPLTLVLRRSLLEIRVAALASADADVGDPLPVKVRDSGKTLRARLTSRDEALAMEQP